MIIGINTLICTHNHNKYNISIYVSSTSGPAILGLHDYRRLNLITINCGNIKIREPSIYEVTTTKPEITTNIPSKPI